MVLSGVLVPTDESKIFNLQHAGGIIGVEYEELLHGNGQMRLLDSV